MPLFHYFISQVLRFYWLISSFLEIKDNPLVFLKKKYFPQELNPEQSYAFAMMSKNFLSVQRQNIVVQEYFFSDDE